MSLRQVGTKVLNMFKKFVYPARILFIRGYAHGKRVVISFVAQLKCCILVSLTVFVVVLTVYYVIRTDSEPGADQKTVRTKTNGAAK